MSYGAAALLDFVITTAKAKPPSSAGEPDVDTIDCSGWFAQSDSQPQLTDYDPRHSAGNTPEGIRYLMRHWPKELSLCTKNLLKKCDIDANVEAEKA